MRKNKIIKRRKRKRLIKNLFKLLLVLVVVVGTTILVRGNRYREHQTQLPTLTIYRDSIESKGYSIYDEKIYKSKGSGIVVHNAYEGQRVPVDFQIANVNLMQDISTLKDELIRVQATLDYKNNVQKSSDKDYKISETQVSIINNIQNFLKDHDYNNVLLSVNNLDLNTSHSVNISELSELLSLTPEELEEKKEELTSRISTNNIDYNAEFSGIVSMIFDGLEEYYNTGVSFDNYTKEYLDKHNNINYSQNKVNVNDDDNLFKLIDNFKWYMAIPVHDKTFLNNVELGDSLEIILNEDAKISGIVYEINESRDSSVVIMEFEDRLMDFYPQRINDVQLIKYTEDAYMIPTSSIVEKEGILGVYIQELHGLLKFVPIEILEEGDYETYIGRGDFRNIINIDAEEYKTITINDPVILDPNLIDNNQIIN